MLSVRAIIITITKVKGGVIMTGTEARTLIKNSGLKFWQVAEQYGLNDGNFSRRLRKPFEGADLERLTNAIATAHQTAENTEV